MTDANGNAVLETVPSTVDQTFNATPPATLKLAAVQTLVAVNAPTSITIVLPPGVSLSGQVTGSGGVPMPNVTVFLGAGSSVTDAGGNYAITVSSGVYRLGISYGGSAANGWPSQASLSIPSYSITADTVLNLSADNLFVPVTAHAQDTNGAPVSGVSIGVDGSVTPPPQQSVVLAGAGAGVGTTYDNGVSDANGNVVMYLLPTTTRPYVVDANPPQGNGREPASQTVTVLAPTNLAYVLPVLYTLSGHVTGLDGLPLQGAHMTLGFNPLLGITAGTDASGSYSLVAAAGTYPLEISFADGASLAAPVSLSFPNYTLSQNRTLDFSAAPLFATLAVHVQDPNGAPVPNVAIGAEGGFIPVDPPQLGLSGGQASLFTVPKTDAHGDALLYLIPSATATYILSAIAPPETLWEPQSLPTYAFTGNSSLTLTLTAYPNPLASEGQTAVVASNPPVLRLTPPAEIDNWNLVPGQDNQFAGATTLQIASNLDCTVTVSTDATSGGFLTQSQGGQYVSPLRQLANPLRVGVDTGSPVALSGLPSVLTQALAVNADPNMGFVFHVDWFQLVGYNDAAVNPPAVYHTVVTFAVSASI